MQTAVFWLYCCVRYPLWSAVVCFISEVKWTHCKTCCCGCAYGEMVLFRTPLPLMLQFWISSLGCWGKDRYWPELYILLFSIWTQCCVCFSILLLTATSWNIIKKKKKKLSQKSIGSRVKDSSVSELSTSSERPGIFFQSSFLFDHEQVHRFSRRDLNWHLKTLYFRTWLA